jgi:hypothetical protein
LTVRGGVAADGGDGASTHGGVAMLRRPVSRGRGGASTRAAAADSSGSDEDRDRRGDRDRDGGSPGRRRLPPHARPPLPAIASTEKHTSVYLHQGQLTREADAANAARNLCVGPCTELATVVVVVVVMMVTVVAVALVLLVRCCCCC